jgi:hypothetical protein
MELRNLPDFFARLQVASSSPSLRIVVATVTVTGLSLPAVPPARRFYGGTRTADITRAQGSGSSLFHGDRRLGRLPMFFLF